MCTYAKPDEVFTGIVPVSRKLYARELYLKRLTLADAARLLSLLSNNREHLKSNMPAFPHDLSLSLTRQIIKEEHHTARLGTRLDFGIFLSDSNKLIGRVALHTVNYDIICSAGLSYWISKLHTRKGLTTRAVATIISFAFEEALLHRVWAEIDVNNIPSKGIVKKLGFRLEGTKARSLFINGNWINLEHYAILEEEYDSLADTWILKGILGV